MVNFKQHLTRLVGLLAIVGSLWCGGGCAEFSSLNPYYRRQWAEDERIAPTYHTFLEKVRGLGAQARSMDRLEQQRVSHELTVLIRDDKNTVLRMAAVRSLSAFPYELAETGLQLAVADPDAQLRIAACDALVRCGHPHAPVLLAGLVESDKALDVRLAATRQLAAYSDPLALRALGIALNDSDPALQYRAVQSLKKATGYRYGDDIALWRAWIRGESPPEPEPSLAELLLPPWF
jgi:hypothetical protein